MDKWFKNQDVMNGIKAIKATDFPLKEYSRGRWEIIRELYGHIDYLIKPKKEPEKSEEPK